MNILADENIPFVDRLFSPLGRVHTISGRSITREILVNIEILLVRSITKVNKDLLLGTPVRFVGTATIGTDHVDETYLRDQNITFVSAAGSNSNSVAEYIILSLLLLAEKQKIDLQTKTLGIIGAGNVGSKVEQKAKLLGMNILPNDPPLQRITGDPRFVTLDQALQADFISLHVPLTGTGPDKTHYLLNDNNLPSLSPSAVLLNTSRGPVVHNHCLNKSLQKNSFAAAVLDVWENEPCINIELLQQVAIGTPHIAGYSLDGKVNGTIMLYKELCKFLGVSAKTITAQELLPPPPVEHICLNRYEGSDQNLLMNAMKTIYDIQRDDHNLRQIIEKPSTEQGKYFDLLRKNYPVRRESHNTRVSLPSKSDHLAHILAGIGFIVT